ncbi:hypothetical protein [Polyangium sorediatum]|uniref:Lipoprotein n=1 Tax=Polyangium sorediatum TaxID=889274 RepID=A0ABT6PB27_9BACT|nr:hypothetical protein [Polyangium sorediatum]MDI1437477.1 hypothetical protein [Polyangium sorediatum]
MKRKSVLLGSIAVCIMSAGCVDSYDEIEDGEIGSAQQAAISYTWAYAWTQQATGSFTASPTYSRNSSGGSNTITHQGTGSYLVQLQGVGVPGNEPFAGGHVQVTAYGSGAERCKPSFWIHIGGNVNVDVNCFTAGGEAVDTRFSIAYVRKSGTGFSHEAYVRANEATTSAYTPDLRFQFNSTGANNTVARLGAGRYTVTLPGQTAVGGTVEVTAYGAGSDHCKVASWTQLGDDMVVSVRCFDSAGALSDSMFDLNFANATHVNGAPSYSYAWTNDATAAAYTPHLSYQKGFLLGWGDVATDITAGRTSTGRYLVNLPGMSSTGSNVQVTAYGSGSESCKVVSWSGDESNANADVACFDSTGAPTDTHFVIVYTDDKNLSIG